MEAQRVQFGVHECLTTTVPEDTKLDQRFDVVVASSFFTHLPRHTFGRWLRVLGGLLAPRGLLLFSVHDVATRGAPSEPTDLVFVERSETDRLSTKDYGTAWTTDAFVRSAIAASLPAASVHVVPKGFANTQDLYVVAAESGADFGGLAVPRQLDHAVDACDLGADGRLRVAGWLADHISGGRPRSVELTVAGHPPAVVDGAQLTADAATGGGLGEAVAIWRFELELPLGRGALSANLTLSLRARCDDGVECLLLQTPLQMAHLQAARLAYLHRHWESQRRERLWEAERQRLDQEWSQRLARAVGETEALRTRIAGMEASRFWRARNRWFALKRALRLTDEA
jgi:hypothetical protein